MEFFLRPARMEDAQAVVDLCNADEGRFRGAATHDLASRKQFWKRTEFSIEDDTQVIELEDGSLAAYAVVQDRPNDPKVLGQIWLDPQLSDPMIESQLLDWLEARAPNKRYDPQANALVQRIPAEDQARALCLAERNYKLVRHFIRMRIDHGESPPPAVFPRGISVRAFRRADDLPLVSMVHQESFRGHWGFVERSREDDIARYRQWLADDPNLEDKHWHLAIEGDEAVGVCQGTAHWPGDEKLAYIFAFGVRPDWRGRGIGKALLQHTFHTFYQDDRPNIELDVDADNTTGALRVYESAGMHAKWQKDLYELGL